MGIKSRIASLVVDLTANSASYNNELKKSKKNTHAWANDVKKYAKIGAAAIAAAGIGAAYGLSKLTSEAMKNADALAKHADKLGITTEALGGLRHQAELNGVAQRALDVGLQRMVRRVSEAAQGTGVAASALAELNINAQELNALSPDQQFAKIADAMADVNTQSDKVRLGFKLFDSEGVGLINAMREGAEGIAAARLEADQLGVTISRIDAAKIEAANDAAYRSDQVWKGLGNTLAVNVSPFITAMETDFVESAKASNGFRDTVSSGMRVIAKSVGYAGNVIRGLQVVFKATQVVAAVFITKTIEHLASLTTGLTEFINKIPGIELELDTNSGIAGYATSARLNLEELKTELHDLAIKKMPSQAVDEWFDRVQAKAQEAAEQVAAVAASSQAPSLDDTQNGFTESDVDKVQSELDQGTDSHVTAYERRQSILDGALNSKQISESRFQQISKNNWTRYQGDIAKVEAARQKAQIATGKQFFGDLATLTDSGNKTLASIGRAAAKINIAISTIDAAQSAYTNAMSWGGPIAAAAAASAAVIAGMMRLKAVDSAGSGGGVSSGGASSGGLSGSTTFDQALPSQSLPNEALSFSSVPVNEENSQTNKTPTVILNEDASKAGQVETSKGLTEEDVISIYVSNINQGGEIAETNEQRYALERVGT